jgi:DNA-directed RNA polymerase subunit RPC12/RpoP
MFLLNCHHSHCRPDVSHCQHCRHSPYWSAPAVATADTVSICHHCGHRLALYTVSHCHRVPTADRLPLSPLRPPSTAVTTAATVSRCHHCGHRLHVTTADTVSHCHHCGLVTSGHRLPLSPLRSPLSPLRPLSPTVTTVATVSHCHHCPSSGTVTIAATATTVDIVSHCHHCVHRLPLLPLRSPSPGVTTPATGPTVTTADTSPTVTTAATVSRCHRSLVRPPSTTVNCLLLSAPRYPNLPLPSLQVRFPNLTTPATVSHFPLSLRGHGLLQP